MKDVKNRSPCYTLVRRGIPRLSELRLCPEAVRVDSSRLFGVAPLQCCQAFVWHPNEVWKGLVPGEVGGNFFRDGFQACILLCAHNSNGTVTVNFDRKIWKGQAKDAVHWRPACCNSFAGHNETLLLEACESQVALQEDLCASETDAEKLQNTKVAFKSWQRSKLGTINGLEVLFLRFFLAVFSQNIILNLYESQKTLCSSKTEVKLKISFCPISSFPGLTSRRSLHCLQVKVPTYPIFWLWSSVVMLRFGGTRVPEWYLI